MTSSTADSLLFYLNGKRVELRNEDVEPELTLLEFVRAQGVTGVKLGCGEGGCGACTVSLAKWDHVSQRVHHEAVNACLFPLCAADGAAVYTTDGIGSSTDPHPVQKRMAESHGSQCGFCTPGIVMAAFARLQTTNPLSEADIDAALDGNLCRCTGYRPILDALRSFSKDTPGTGCLPDKDFPQELRTYKRAVSTVKVLGQRPVTEVKGPGKSVWHKPRTLEEVCRLKSTHGSAAKLVAGNTEIGVDTKFRKMHFPILVYTKSVPELCKITVSEPETSATTGEDGGKGYIDVGGGATLSALRAVLLHETEHRKPSFLTRNFRALLEMLKWFASTQIRNAATLAGNIVTASPISDTCHTLVAMGASVELARFDPKNGAITKRRVAMGDFFLGYRKVDCASDEVVASIRVPMTSKWEFIRSYKQGQRREDDIAICGAGLRVVIDPKNGAVQQCQFMYGGMAPLVKRASHAENFCIGKSLDFLTSGEARHHFGELARNKDFNLAANVPGGRPDFRMALAASFLYKFFVGVRQDFSSVCPNVLAPLTEIERSASLHLVHESGSTAIQQHSSVLKGGLVTTAGPGVREKDGEGPPKAVSSDAKRGPVGEPRVHTSGLLQCTGEALYTDDVNARASRRGTLQAAFVYTTKACVNITNVDTSEALAMEGVVTFVDANDIPVGGTNLAGHIARDETVFMPLNQPVECVGRIVGLVVAQTRRQALAAAAAVRVTYATPAENIGGGDSKNTTGSDPIFSIDDAIKAESFHCDELVIRNGDVDAIFSAASQNDDIVVVEGEVKLGGQEHFYLETQAAYAMPGERADGEMHILASTQGPTGTQAAVQHILGLPAHKVTVQVKRLGGGFGGKESRAENISAAIALAAYKLNKPVAIQLDRDEDMKSSGGRHPFLGRYRAAAQRSSGKLLALKVNLFSNGGWSLDLSRGVLERALYHADNAYKWPSVHIAGRVCKTNMPSNTAFRGFGGPQGMLIGETAVEHLATTLGVAAEDLRQQNLYTKGDLVPYGMTVGTTQLGRLWTQVKDLADWPERQKSVASFNKAHRWRKRGAAILPTKFGIAFGANFLNQGGALVHIYLDGTVLVTHGGVEMGQGLHTKMIQVAARALQVDMSCVHIAETTTDKVPNTSASAASSSSDLYGMAVLQACEKIVDRLEKMRSDLSSAPPGSANSKKALELEKMSTDTSKNGKAAFFKKLVTTAYMERISLSATGFHKTPTRQYDWSTETPDKPDADDAIRGPFNYFSEGAACCEVELDVLTGDMRVVHASVVMDVGNSLNSAIDIGQIEGAFIQGLGLFALEELMWGDADHPWVRPGQLFSSGPGTYKIPSFGDLPHRFQVRLLDDSPNPRTIHSSKAVGEPPFFLAASAFFAARRAVASARAAHLATASSVPLDATKAWFALDSPASSERLRMSCIDEITDGMKIPSDYRAFSSV